MKYATLNPIAKVGLDKFPQNYVLTENAEEADVLLVRSASMLEMEFSKNLLAIGRAGAGVNNIPVDRCREEGIVVFNTPGANANAVKELTLAALFLASRDIAGGMNWVAENKGDENIGKTMEKAKKKFAGCEIYGKTLGVIGLGAIGFMVANAAVSLGMKVVGYDPFLSDYAKQNLNPEVKVVSLDELYAEADYITIHVPETPDTKGTYSKAAFEKMKDGVILLNLARAGLANDDDLKEALESGKVAKYVTDVPSFKSANMKNVVAFPHLGASTEEAEDNCAMMVAEELTDFLENGNIRNSVNFPKLSLGEKTGPRVAVIFRTAAVSVDELCNVPGAKNKAVGEKNGVAYGLFDAEDLCASQKVQKMDGVLKVRAF